MAKERKTVAKSAAKKPGIGVRLMRFFKNLRTEIKKVVWPDKKRLIQSTATVLMIVLSAALIIWIFDTVISLILTSIGFYTPAATTAAVQPDPPAVTETVHEALPTLTVED
jgi:preprotein translocase subunit SecE